MMMGLISLLKVRRWEAVFDIEVIVENDIRPSAAAARLSGRLECAITIAYSS